MSSSPMTTASKQDGTPKTFTHAFCVPIGVETALWVQSTHTSKHSLKSASHKSPYEAPGSVRSKEASDAKLHALSSFDAGFSSPSRYHSTSKAPSLLRRPAKTIIFLHDYGATSNSWLEVSNCLPQHRSIAVDLRGWGKSTGPNDVDNYTIRHMAGDIGYLISELKDVSEYFLAGHGMGAKVAQVVASRQPAGLQGLILIAPAPASPLMLSAFSLKQTSDIHLAYSGNPLDFWTYANCFLTAPAYRTSEQHVQQLYLDNLSANNEAKTAWPERGMQEDYSPALREIKVPVVIVAGEADKLFEVGMVEKEVCRRLRTFTSVVLKECGHLIPLEKPRELAHEIARFVDHVEAFNVLEGRITIDISRREFW